MFGRKKSEVEFRGVSASNDKRSAAMLFIVEAVVVLLFIAGVLFVLNFVGIISLSSINSNLFGRLPVQVEKDITVNSDRADVNVSIQNEKELIRYLEDWEIIGTPQDWGAWGSTGNQNLNKINVTLVSEEIPENATVDGEGNIHVGSTVNMTGDTANFRVYLSDTVLNESSQSPEELGNAFMSGLITPIYRAKYPSTIESPNLQAPDLFEIIGGLAERNYFRIEKR